jgi:hypothetical protein
METSTIILIVIGVLLLFVVVAVAARMAAQRRQSEQLQEKFGPEYEYVVDKMGDQREAEMELANREKRVKALEIRILTSAERGRYLNEWNAVQANFVDQPKEAVEAANILIQEVMRERGFPVADFEQRAADISVIYPNVVPNYRAAHDIATQSQRDGVSTEDLRQAMVHYRSLFEELLNETENKETT